MLKRTALIAMAAGAAGSIALMLYAGRRQESRILLLLFGIWVLSPFAAGAAAGSVSKRWAGVTRAAIDLVTVVITLGSLAIYGYVAFAHTKAKAGFVFLVVPLASWLLIALAVGAAAVNSRRDSRRGKRTADYPGGADTRLAVYGTLAPGKINHHQISALAGTWQRGTVRGKVFVSGSGATMGFAGLVLDPLDPLVKVELFESAELPEHWDRLDEFEGSGYQRVVTTVKTEAGDRSACIYVLAQEPRQATD